MKIRINKIPDYFWLALIIILAYISLISGRAILKWDIIDINLPWNYFITESLKNGILPLWNPYSECGFPIYGDPGTWYPFTWLLGLFRYYDIISNHITFLFHTFIAGYGMYKLTLYLISSRKVALLAGICYMLSGFFVGNAQHIRWLITAAWLPFSIYYFLKLYKTPDLKVSIKLGIVISLMLSGGYPAILFSFIYVLLLMYIVFLFKGILRKISKKHLIKWNFYLFISIIVFFILSLVVIISSFDFMSFVNRGEPLVYNDNKGVLLGSLPLKALYSFIFPFATGYQDISFWGQDFSVLNCYCGFFTLIILIFAIFVGKINKNAIILILGGILALMIAMAEVFPFRYWLYKYLPLMNYFRFSSFFRLYTIFTFILAFAYTLKNIENNSLKINQLNNFLIVILIILSVYLIFVYLETKKDILFLIKSDFLSFRQLADVKARIFVQGIILVFLLIFLVIFLKKIPGKAIYIIIIVSVLDILQSNYLNLYDTVAYKGKICLINEYCKNFPTGFPLP